MAQDCIFCKIAAGDIEADVVLENDHIIAFRDTHPAAPTHILVIPKKHIPSLTKAELADVDVLGALQLAAARLAQEQGLENGYRVVTNCGEDGGQSVPHLHYHLLGGRNLTWPPG